jgi:antitoxin component YwqK of YwqJK toxin-antitoxin module
MYLDKIKEKYSKYLSDSSYVYKYNQNCIIILQKLDGDNPTKTNGNKCIEHFSESFLASHLKVILIFDINDLDIEYDSIIDDDNYQVGQIIYCENFNLDKTNNNELKGITYFKTIHDAFFSSNIRNNYTGKYCSYYDNGSLLKECEYENGLRSGSWTIWYDNGLKKRDGFYKKDKKIGRWLSWYKNGQKADDKEYLKGKLDGKVIKWYYDGTKMSEKNYINNELNGICTDYSILDGKKMTTYQYVNGKKNGKSIEYFDGKKISEGNYVNDLKNGIWIYWLGKAKSSEIEYLNDKKIKEKVFVTKDETYEYEYYSDDVHNEKRRKLN